MLNKQDISTTSVSGAAPRLMKKLAITIVILATMVALPSLALAQEAAKYSFATAQGNANLQVMPGGECRGVIYFYNVDGNRITHITLGVSQAPDNWQVEIEPPLGVTQVSFGGQIINVTENLYVEPLELHPEPIEDIPEGMVCLPIGDRGYALAKPAYIVIHVPQSEEIGTTGDITISGTAKWLGQTGAAAMSQARDFDFSVAVVSEVTDETIVTPGKFSAFIHRWLPVIIAVIIVIIAAVLIPRFVIKRS